MFKALHTDEGSAGDCEKLGLGGDFETAPAQFVEGIVPHHVPQRGWSALFSSREPTPLASPRPERGQLFSEQSPSDAQLPAPLQEQRIGLPEEAEREAQAHKEAAYAAGFAVGEQRGFEVGQQRVESLLQDLGRALQEVGRLRAQILAQSERNLLDLALAIARKVLHHEGSCNRDAILPLLRAGIKRATQRQELRIKVHPADILFAMSCKAHLQSFLDGIDTITFEEDETIPPGSCIIETPAEIVDLRWDEQLDELAARLFETYDDRHGDGG